MARFVLLQDNNILMKNSGLSSSVLKKKLVLLYFLTVLYKYFCYYVIKVINSVFYQEDFMSTTTEKKNRPLILKNDVMNALKTVGVKKGQNIIVHCSLSSIGFVCGGPQIIIESLLESVGAEGTILMPTQSWKNLDPETGVHWEEPVEWWNAIRENWPAYNKYITPTNTMGAVAEMFRTCPGTMRSDHPARSFAANGRNARLFTNNHDLSNIFGDGSPLGRLYDEDGNILLIGVGYDKNTSLHLADARADFKSKHNTVEHSAIMENGVRVWKAYETLAVDGEDFDAIGEAFESSAENAGFIHKTTLGNATLRFIKMRPLVDFAVKWIEANRK